MSENKGKPKVGCAKAIVFSIIPMLLLFILIEGAARALPPIKAPGAKITDFMGGSSIFREDPLLKWRVVQGSVKGFKLNSGGFRGGEFPSGAKKAGETRILVLGDSTSWGMGVSDNQVWPVLLGDILKRKKIFEKPVMLNAAAPGYTSFQGRLLLESEMIHYKPDIIITYFGVNDASSRPGMGRDSKWKLPSMRLVPAIRLLRKSAFYRDMMALTLIVKQAGKEKPTYQGRKGYIQRVTPAEYGDNISAMEKIAEPGTLFLNISPVWSFNGIARNDLAIVVFTKKGTYTVHSKEGQLYAHEPSLDLAELLSSRGDNGEKLFLDYCHLSPEGHKILAEEVAARLEKMKK